MYVLELDALPAKQQAVSEKMKKLEVAVGDSRSIRQCGRIGRAPTLNNMSETVK